MIIVACLQGLVQPFILLAWQVRLLVMTARFAEITKILWGRRLACRTGHEAAVSAVSLISVTLLVNSIVDGGGPLIHAVTGGDMTLPDLHVK